MFSRLWICPANNNCHGAVPESCQSPSEQLKGRRVPDQTGAVLAHWEQLTGKYHQPYELRLDLPQPLSCVYSTISCRPGAIGVTRQVMAHNLSLAKTAKDQELSLLVASH